MSQPAAAQDAPVVPPQPSKHPLPDTPFVESKAQSVADKMEEKMFGPVKVDDKTPPAKEPEPAKQPDGQQPPADGELPPAKADENTPAPTDDVQNLIDKRKGKTSDNVDKRKDKIQADIDALTAQKKALADEVAALEKQKTSQPADKEGAPKKGDFPQYSEEELAAATQKALEEQDLGLLMEIQTYREQRLELKLTQKYQEDKQSGNKQKDALEAEWKQVTGKFTPAVYQQENIKNDPDFDVNNQKGLLFRLAKGLYEDPELASVYKVPGGMMKATQDAFNDMLLDRAATGFKPGNGKTNVTKDSSLQTQLEKEKRKNALGAGGEGAIDGTGTNQQANSDELSSYISERRQLKNKGMRGTGL